MPDEIHYRCELTAELLDRAEPELDAALWAFSERVYAATRRRVPRSGLRITGIALAVVGILLAWVLIVLAPPCSRRSLAMAYTSLPLFVILATVYAFEPSVTVELRGWARRMTARRARRLADAVRRKAPYEIEYVVSGARLEGHVARLALHRVTDLGSVQEAIAGDRLACLFTRRWPGRLRRVVWFRDAAARTAVLDALRRAGVDVVQLNSATAVPGAVS